MNAPEAAPEGVESPSPSVVTVTVSRTLAAFLDGALHTLAHIARRNEDAHRAACASAALLQLRAWLVSSIYRWSLLPSLRGSPATGDLAVKSFVKYSCEVLVPFLGAEQGDAECSSLAPVTTAVSMMNQVLGCGLWYGLVDKRSQLKEALQEALNRRRRTSESVTTAPPKWLPEAEFVAVVGSYLDASCCLGSGLRLSIPVPLLESVLESLRHTVHEETLLVPASGFDLVKEAVSACPTWFHLVRFLNLSSPQCPGSEDEPLWLWFAGMSIYETSEDEGGAAALVGVGSSEAASSSSSAAVAGKGAPRLFASVKKSAVEGMHVDCRLIGSSSLRYLEPLDSIALSQETTTAVKRVADDVAYSLPAVARAIYRLFLHPIDSWAGIHMQSPSSSSCSPLSSAVASSTLSTFLHAPFVGDAVKAAAYVSAASDELAFHRGVDLPLYLANIELKCARLVAIFISTLRERHPSSQGHTTGDTNRVEITKLFGGEASRVLDYVPPPGEVANACHHPLPTERAELATAALFSICGSPPVPAPHADYFKRECERRMKRDRLTESHLRGLLTINEISDDAAYRRQVTGEVASFTGTHGGGEGPVAGSMASAQQVPRRETFSAFFKEASIAFDMRIMSIAAAIVGYAMAHFRGMSPGVCVVFAAVCAALMSMVDAMLLFTRLTKDDQARAKRIRADGHASRQKERRRL